MNGGQFRIRDSIVAVWVMGTLLGCFGGGFGMTYNILDDQHRLTPAATERGYQYNLSEGSWELAPAPLSEEDIEILHLDDDRYTTPDINGAGRR